MLDIRMPGMDGLEVQQVLQDRGVSLPVIIMTGHGDVALAVKAMKAGAVDFIEKPFEKQTLLASLEEGYCWLSHKEATHDRMRDANLRLHALTSRERDVLKGLAGLPNKMIAFDLDQSSHGRDPPGEPEQTWSSQPVRSATHSLCGAKERNRRA